MPLASLNDLCVRNDWERPGNVRQLVSEEAAPAELLKLTTAVEEFAYSVAWGPLTATEAADLQAFWESYRFTRSFTWTPPDASAGKYRFAAFDLRGSGNNYEATATLAHYNGV